MQNRRWANSGFARCGHLIDSGKHEIPIAAGNFRVNWRRNELARANLHGSVSSIKKFSSLEMLNRYISPGKILGTARSCRDPCQAIMKLEAKPGPIEIDLTKSAVVVVDMQNAFAARGGMLDIAGADISDAPRVVGSIKRVLAAARKAGVLVVYLQMGYKPDLSNSGGPNSPNYHKELAMHLMNCRPELKGKLLTEGTWDFAIVDELKPEAGDLVVLKTRYSGFAGTTLDSQLRTRGIRYLFFSGIATNVCVESTLRDAYFQDYWPILIADGAMPAGPASLHEATIFNVENFFGWTVGAKEFLRLLSATNS